MTDATEVERGGARPLAPGATVCDGVRLTRLLGEGGMGSVWLAENVHLGAPVVVKFMSPALSHDPSALARFTREAKLASRIRSPHVVQIFDCRLPAGDADDVLPFMVMEHLEGEDLASRLQGGPLSLTETAEVVTHVCRALDAAHEHKVIHRDVKPENIFLVDTGGRPFAKLLDFGIAKDAAGDIALDVTAAGATMGTPHYMSPEQMLSPKEVDGRCDLWAAAVVAYACLTGRIPFEGDTFGALVLRIHRGEYAPPSAVSPSVPRAVDAWFARALHRDIRERFQTAREMSDALIEVAYGERTPSLVRLATAAEQGLQARVPKPPPSDDEASFSDLTPPPSVRTGPPPPPRAARRGSRNALVAASLVTACIGALSFASGPGSPAHVAAPPLDYDASIPLPDARDIVADGDIDARVPGEDAGPMHGP